MGSRSYERIAGRYEQARGGEERARSIGDAVRPWLDGASTVCDVGVGKTVVVPRLDALRGLPGPDQSRRRVVSHPLWVWHRP